MGFAAKSGMSPSRVLLRGCFVLDAINRPRTGRLLPTLLSPRQPSRLQPLWVSLRTCRHVLGYHYSSMRYFGCDVFDQCFSNRCVDSNKQGFRQVMHRCLSTQSSVSLCLYAYPMSCTSYALLMQTFYAPCAFRRRIRTIYVFACVLSCLSKM